MLQKFGTSFIARWGGLLQVLPMLDPEVIGPRGELPARSRECFELWTARRTSDRGPQYGGDLCVGCLPARHKARIKHAESEL